MTLNQSVLKTSKQEELREVLASLKILNGSGVFVENPDSHVLTGFFPAE